FRRGRFFLAALRLQRGLQTEQGAPALGMALQLLAVHGLGGRKIALAQQGLPQRIARGKIPCRRLVVGELVFRRRSLPQPSARAKCHMAVLIGASNAGSASASIASQRPNSTSSSAGVKRKPSRKGSSLTCGASTAWSLFAAASAARALPAKALLMARKCRLWP